MIWSAFKISLLATTLATSVVVVIGTACAFILAKGKFRGREALDALITLPLVLPPTVTGYYLIVLFGRRGLIGSYLYDLTGWTVTFTLWAAVIAASVMALPLMVKSARAAIESDQPAIRTGFLHARQRQGRDFFASRCRWRSAAFWPEWC